MQLSSNQELTRLDKAVSTHECVKCAHSQDRSWNQTHPVHHGALTLQSVFSLTILQVLEIIKRQSSALYEEVMGIASDVFNTLLERAVKLQRNYILDQAK